MPLFARISITGFRSSQSSCHLCEKEQKTFPNLPIISFQSFVRQPDVCCPSVKVQWSFWKGTRGREMCASWSTPSKGPWRWKIPRRFSLNGYRRRFQTTILTVLRKQWSFPTKALILRLILINWRRRTWLKHSAEPPEIRQTLPRSCVSQSALCDTCSINMAYVALLPRCAMSDGDQTPHPGDAPLIPRSAAVQWTTMRNLRPARARVSVDRRSDHWSSHWNISTKAITRPGTPGRPEPPKSPFHLP